MSGFAHHLLDLVEKIPATFWAFIIAGVFSLGGVLLTNRAHDRRLKAQLAHDRDLNERDRAMSLRRDVYLPAVEAVSAGLIAVGRFANLEVPDDKLTEEYVGKAPSIAKAHVIATQTTVKAIAEFSAELGVTFLRLFARRLPLIRQAKEIAFLRGQIDTFSKEQLRITELMKQYNLDGLPDQRRWEVLEKNYDVERHRIDETTHKADALAAILYPRQLQFAEEGVGETIRLGCLLVPVIASVRKEVELPFDETEYRMIVDAAAAKQVESLREFMQELQSEIAGRRA